ncbi:hypothetical protein D1P53_005585 [Cryptococcus gattii VGV]|nr:hypothetical protein D1P53_005585 [Cryptococcus gattii VGV]
MSTTMVPVPQEELPVLEALINIRNRLTALKKDTTRFIRAPDVMPIYNSVVKQITRLNAIRDEQQQSHSALHPASGSSTKPPPLPEANRVDQLLADVFGLLSLFFLTVGKSRETPAIYCQIASMRQILSHMDESGAYTEQFLIPFRERLDQLRSVIKQDSLEGKHPEPIVRLMIRKLEGVERQLDALFQSLTVLSVELVPIHNRLVQLRKELAALAAEPKPNKAEYKAILEELRKVDSKRVDETCFEITQDIKAREAEEEVGPTLKPIYDRLSEMKNQLDQMTLTHRWTLRETDLYNYAMSLREIDAMRVDGKFVDAAGDKAEGQYVSPTLCLFHRQYMLTAFDPGTHVPPPTMLRSHLPPHVRIRAHFGRTLTHRKYSHSLSFANANKLSTIKKCLNEVLKYGGPYTPRDLYPYHLALHQIDSLRKDGKFYADDGSIPEGQAILVAQLSEAHELLEMLKESMSDGESDDE